MSIRWSDEEERLLNWQPFLILGVAGASVGALSEQPLGHALRDLWLVGYDHVFQPYLGRIDNIKAETISRLLTTPQSSLNATHSIMD